MEDLTLQGEAVEEEHNGTVRMNPKAWYELQRGTVARVLEHSDAVNGTRKEHLKEISSENGASSMEWFVRHTVGDELEQRRECFKDCARRFTKLGTDEYDLLHKEVMRKLDTNFKGAAWKAIDDGKCPDADVEVLIEIARSTADQLLDLYDPKTTPAEEKYVIWKFLEPTVLEAMRFHGNRRSGRYVDALCYWAYKVVTPKNLPTSDEECSPYIRRKHEAFIEWTRRNAGINGVAMTYEQAVQLTAKRYLPALLEITVERFRRDANPAARLCLEKHVANSLLYYIRGYNPLRDGRFESGLLRQVTEFMNEVRHLPAARPEAPEPPIRQAQRGHGRATHAS